MKKATLILTAIAMIASFSLTAQMIITTNSETSADGSAMLEVESTTKGFLPPRMTETERDAITATAGLMIYNTTSYKPNYFNGTEWLNFDNTSTVPVVGDSYAGGIVVYILESGDPGYVEGETHGFIVATCDQSTGIQWYNGGNVTTGATGQALGTGSANTTTIITVQEEGSYAAQICAAYTVEGYSDWFLPSKDELNKLYSNSTINDGFSGFYWTSSESSYSNAWVIWFPSMGPTSTGKSSTYNVRAFRAF